MRASVRCLAALAILFSFLLALIKGADSLPAPSVDQLRFGDPVMVAAGSLRILALALVLYLVATTLLSLAALVTGSAALLNLTGLITPRLLNRLTGLALTASLTAGSTPALADEDVPTMRRVSPAGQPVNSEIEPDPAAAGGTVHIVSSGENFWSIAEEQIGPAASSTVLTDYWKRLVRHNSGRLVSPGNPHLLFPGQALELPEK